MPTSKQSINNLYTLKTYLLLSRDVDIKNTSTFARVRIVVNFQTQSFLFYLTDKRLFADDLLAAVWEVIKDPQDTVCKFQGAVVKPDSDASDSNPPA